ncbi:hypothetical protein GGR57DRAFT_512234 [Xylariaceae sp. FL1272]|nr:hypothetical protein GGR57DRAFT_512234 [Xylariaceae sp. FL1272]
MSCRKIKYPDDCFNMSNRGSFQPDPDISGIGVTIGFVGTGYLVLILVIANYLFAFDPAANPFIEHNDGSHGHGSSSNWWTPNRFDVLILEWFRKLPGIRRVKNRLSCLKDAFNESIIALCDVQVITGLAMLITGFALLDCGISAYDWQVIASLAWFSVITHLAGLSVLRSHLRAHAWKRRFRLLLMTALFGLWVRAVIPTIFFAWPTYAIFALPGDFARCYQDIQMGIRIGQWKAAPKISWTVESLALAFSFESTVTSLGLATFGFIIRFGKLYRFTSKFASTVVRDQIGNAMEHFILGKLEFEMRISNKSGQRPSRTRLFLSALWRSFCTQHLLALFVHCRLIIDLQVSMLAEVFWLMVSLVWGTFKLADAPQKAIFVETGNPLAAPERSWSFGQILAVLLLAAPVVTVITTLTSGLEIRYEAATQGALRQPTSSRRHSFNTEGPRSPHGNWATETGTRDSIKPLSTSPSTMCIKQMPSINSGLL